MRYALLALLLALPFATGCRDALVDVPGDPGITSGPLRSMYLKGPPVIRVGETVQFRGEPFLGATYSWAVEGEAEFATPSNGGSRDFLVQSQGPGNLTITVTALMDGVPYAQARRVVVLY